MARKILLVEGPDDEHVMKHLCGNRGLQRLDVKPQGGVEQLLNSFPVWLKASQEGDVYGLVIDADVDVKARWQSIRYHLGQAGYADVPDIPNAEGTILDPPQDRLLPRVGIWIMPDNQTNGILEDFLRFLVPVETPLFSHVESSVQNIPEGDRLFSNLAHPKVIIHTWLAWQKEPGKPLGTAITAKFLDHEVAQVDTLISWLDRLFFS